MPSTAAQDEFNALFNNSSSTGRTHPEDQDDRSQTDSHQEPQIPRQHLSPLAASRNAQNDRDSQYDDLDNSRPPSFNGSVMRRNYYLPKTRSEANTGPKGVIADAQAFQLARREASRAASRAASSVSLAGNQTPAFQMGLDTIELQESERSSADDDDNDEADEGFLAKWRASRLSELASGKRPWYKKTSNRKYGSLEHVDADRYLDAVEKSGKDTVVVVYIFDDMSEVSGCFEKCLRELARDHPSVRFVKLHHEAAEIDIAAVPAILAYRNGDMFKSMMPLFDEIPDDQELSAESLLEAMKRHSILT